MHTECLMAGHALLHQFRGITRQHLHLIRFRTDGQFFKHHAGRPAHFLERGW